MKGQALRALVLMVVVAASVYAWRVLFPSDATQIRRQLTSIVDAVNTPADGVGAVTRAVQIAGAFTEDVVVEGGHGQPLRGRDVVVGALAHLPDRARDFRAGIEDVQVSVADDRSHAHVELTATATSADGDTDARELSLEMVKSERKWLIARVTAVAPLQK